MVDRERSFSSEEVSQIVREALEFSRSDAHRALSYEDLEDVARQCGVDAETLARTLEHRELQGRRDTLLQRWRVQALYSLFLPVFFCGFFVFLNLRSGSFPWALFPIAFWLVPVALRAWRRAFPTDERIDQALAADADGDVTEDAFERDLRMHFGFRSKRRRGCHGGGAARASGR